MIVHRSKLHIFIFLLIFSCLAVNGCGYRNPYVQQNIAAAGTKTVFLDIWSNRTNELGLETQIYRNLVSWFNKLPNIKLTRNQEDAEYLLTGEIRTIRVPALSYGQFDQAVEVKVILTVSYSLEEQASDNVLLQQTDLTFSEAAQVGSDTITYRTNKNKALAIINDDLAERVYLDTVSSLFPLQTTN